MFRSVEHPFLFIVLTITTVLNASEIPSWLDFFCKSDL